MKTENYNAGLERLRRLYAALSQKDSDGDYQGIVQSRDAALGQYKGVYLRWKSIFMSSFGRTGRKRNWHRNGRYTTNQENRKLLSIRPKLGASIS
jgi:hypothetical protein